MSKYYQLLQGPAKESFVEKLRLLGFTESDDPYSESNVAKFTDNLTLDLVKADKVRSFPLAPHTTCACLPTARLE